MDWSLPEGLAARERLVTRFGAEIVEPWWRQIPAVVDGFGARWSLDLVEIVGRGGTSLVIRCVHGARGAYLKLSPDPGFAEREAAALDHWAATGRSPIVEERNLGAGVLLLEAMADGRPLADRAETPSLEQVGELIAALHGTGLAAGEAVAELPPIADHVAFTFDRMERRFLAEAQRVAPGLVHTDHLRRGRERAVELAGDAASRVLLHGDLHPGNVLPRGERLVAIDPRPHVGDPAYELVDWISWRAEPEDWPARATQLGTLTGVEPQRAWAWFTAFAALLALPELAHESRVTPRAAALLAAAT